MTDDFSAVAARLGARGCTHEEITEVEDDQGVPLTAGYREFLRTMGRDAGGLFRGTHVVFPEILGLRESTAELLLENHVPDLLPASAVIIYMHQGYVIGFVDPEEGFDPPVRRWMEGEDDPRATRIVASSVLEWILDAERAAQQDVRFRLAGRNERIPASERETCPRCATRMQWSGRAIYSNDLPPEHSGRNQMVAHCPGCQSDFWRWADDLASPLQPDRT